MGCYMSTPDDKVYITEGKGKNYRYATASCQGWRREQEDAEDCIPYFDDEDASLFVLCDGHGGAEVAKYTVEHLPNFIKNHPLYKEGKYEEALERAFIDFDALLRTEEVMTQLNQLALDEDKRKNPDDAKMDAKIECNEPNSCEQSSSGREAEPTAGGSSGAGTSSSNGEFTTVADDVDTETLRREAQVPLTELLDKYSQAKRALSLKYTASPVVRSSQKRGDDEDDDEKEFSSTSQPAGPSASSSDQEPSSSSTKKQDEEPSQGPSSSDVQSLKDSLIKQVMQRYFTDADSSEDDDEEDSEFEGVEDETDSDEEEDDDEDDDGDDEDDDDATEECKSKRLKSKHRRSKSKLATKDSLKDSSSDDGEDQSSDESDYDDSEEGGDTSETGSKTKKKTKQSREGDDEEDSESEDGEEEEDEEEVSFDIESLNRMRHNTRVHQPGHDSGCTVVVALIKNNKLYVASAGDSRCIVITRNGECKPMTFDHKPEDPIEVKRITNAGGRVTEGRVNGGLNLSRALGDFSYKDERMDAKQQMITPCPDVKTHDLSSQVEYIFLACDGIWNSMRNQQATKFIREVAQKVQHNLVDICVGLFRNCIAPGTDGDGSGCDNMTCILVHFDDTEVGKNSLSDLKTETAKHNEGDSKEGNDQLATADSTNKRSADENEELKPATKRRCMRSLELNHSSSS